MIPVDIFVLFTSSSHFLLGITSLKVGFHKQWHRVFLNTNACLSEIYKFLLDSSRSQICWRINITVTSFWILYKIISIICTAVDVYFIYVLLTEMIILFHSNKRIIFYAWLRLFCLLEGIFLDQSRKWGVYHNIWGKL